MDISKIKCFLLDLDGTVYIDGELIGDMKNTLESIRKSGRKIVYLTNNSSRSASKYVERLKNIGIYNENDVMYSSGDAAASYIKRNYCGKSVYLMGTEALKSDFIKAGITLSDDADLLVVGFDTELTYDKLLLATKHLVKGVPYIVTHPDINCPAKDFSIPDVGSFMALFEKSTGRTPDLIIGKPNTIMGEEIMQMTGFIPEEIVMVGDRLYTDIMFGVNNKFSTMLVLSGETTLEDYKKSGIKATYVTDSLNDVKKYL